MLITLSPAKSLDYDSRPPYGEYTQPRFLAQSKELVAILKKKSAAELSKLFGVSEGIGSLNQKRYQEWKPPFTTKNAKQAIFAFDGSVYRRFDFACYKKKDFENLQKSVRILSGLYGVLKPLDLIQPYRLEMGTKLPNKKGKDLYAFWKETVTESLNKEKDKLLINLASTEYYSVIDFDKLNKQVITPIFKDFNKGTYKVIGFSAKKTRGLYANWLVTENPKDLTSFTGRGYAFSKKDSTDSEYVFLRKK